MRNRIRSYVQQAIRAQAPEDGEGTDFEAGRVAAVISSGDVARDQAIIEPKGWDFRNFMRNPVVLYMHDDGFSNFGAGNASGMPIGRSSKPTVDDEGLTSAIASFDMEDDVAVRVLGKIQRGFINATSVRWIPLEHRIEKRKRADGAGEQSVIVFTRSEMIEWSFVVVPADPAAVILRSEGGAVALLDALSDFDPQAPSRRDLNLDPLNLGDVLGAAYALMAGRSEGVFTPEELAAASRLYGEIAGRIETEPQQVVNDHREELERALTDLARQMNSVADGIKALRSDTPDFTGIAAQAIAAATGRSVESIRSLMTMQGVPTL